MVNNHLPESPIKRHVYANQFPTRLFTEVLELLFGLGLEARPSCLSMTMGIVSLERKSGVWYVIHTCFSCDRRSNIQVLKSYIECSIMLSHSHLKLSDYVKLSGIIPMRPTTPKGPKVAHGSISTGEPSGKALQVPKLTGRAKLETTYIPI